MEEATLRAAPLGVGNREEHARVVGFLDDAGSWSYRQTIALLNLVYHLHRLALPPGCYPLYAGRLHAASLAICQLAHSLPPESTPAVAIFLPTKTILFMDHERAPWPPRRSEAERRRARCGFPLRPKDGVSSGLGRRRLLPRGGEGSLSLPRWPLRLLPRARGLDIAQETRAA